MKRLALASVFLVLASVNFAFADDYPTMPSPQLTPGALCSNPDSHRYPENIAYCSRNVDTMTKKEVIANYDRTFGYKIEQMQRSQFKIDHYIPLCMGGANSTDNLWPQHETVYTITDPLEAALCEKMSEGKLLQKDAVALIKEGKNHLDEVPAILKKLQSM